MHGKKVLQDIYSSNAGMRELDKTLWILNNRVRMIVGSFLVKHLLIHWREGEKNI